MGQYYRPTIVTPDGRILLLDPYDFNNGAKLTEHSWIGNDLVNAASSLILNSPKQVAWIGDYSNDDYEICDEEYTKVYSFNQFINYYDAAWGENPKVISHKLFSKPDLTMLDYGNTNWRLINHDKHIYINLDVFTIENTTRGGLWDGWCMNPLPLLTACGNGRGGGDYGEDYVGYANIGSWAFNHLDHGLSTIWNSLKRFRRTMPSSNAILMNLK